ncbi:hypothetical protein GIB67_042759 [Kingdonia uniflora]|uniref:CBS domain-containing protein n=1 Tax=Kingdonia uniflora TaxID=39325 RepID=A0A7J7L155_9MAGN|nr:hypothetical protein GIB67_042759 [Kingdonia uniflora]
MKRECPNPRKHFALLTQNLHDHIDEALQEMWGKDLEEETVNAAGKGGDLSHDETTIIAGALELTEKTAKDAMTPISKAFSLDLGGTLDLPMLNSIMTMGHSRVPVYSGMPTNIIGIILVKNLLTVDPNDAVPLKKMTLRKIPRCAIRTSCSVMRDYAVGIIEETFSVVALPNTYSMTPHEYPGLSGCRSSIRGSIPLARRASADGWVSENLPLYDILNEFQKGQSHIAVVIRDLSETKETLNKTKEVKHIKAKKRKGPQNETAIKEESDGVSSNAAAQNSGVKVEFNDFQTAVTSKDGDPRPISCFSTSPGLKKRHRGCSHCILDVGNYPIPEFSPNEEVVGVITMEDVIEELLQEMLAPPSLQKENGFCICLNDSLRMSSSPCPLDVF